VYKDGALGGADEDAAVDASVSDVGGGLAYFVSFGLVMLGSAYLSTVTHAVVSHT